MPPLPCFCVCKRGGYNVSSNSQLRYMSLFPVNREPLIHCPWYRKFHGYLIGSEWRIVIFKQQAAGHFFGDAQICFQPGPLLVCHGGDRYQPLGNTTCGEIGSNPLKVLNRRKLNEANDVNHYWKEQYERAASTHMASLLTRLTTFFLSNWHFGNSLALILSFQCCISRLCS